MVCDMCRSQGKMYKAEVEGAILSLCANCSKFGKVLGAIAESKFERISSKKAEEKPELIEAIVDDYADRIRKKREEIGLTQRELAAKLNEKESLIHQLESGRFNPNIGLAKKLQNALGIRLIEQQEEKREALSHGKLEGFTIGDFIKVKKKSDS